MKLDLNVDAVVAGLEGLVEKTYSVSRTMGAAVGAAMRDEAKSRVNSKSGLLASALVVKYAADESTDTLSRYVVTWNRKKAPHGHLVEFGHVRTNVIVQLPSGQWITTNEKLPKPEHVRAKPFLRPAGDTILPVAMTIAGRAGMARWNELTGGNR